MVKTVFYIILFFVCSAAHNSYAQKSQIDLQKEELNKLKDEISRLESELAQKNKKEKKSLEDFNNISKQNFLVSKILANLRSEEAQKEKEIKESISNISDIENEIEQLQKNYAKYVAATYKNGKHTEWETVLDANSFQQAVIRLEYLKRFSVSRKKDLEKFETNKKDLLIAKAKLEAEKKDKEILTQQKEVEEKALSKKLKTQKSILAEIKKDKKKISKSVNDKRKSEQKIRDLIVKMVEEAEAKRKREEELKLKKPETVIAAETEVKTKKEVDVSEYNFDLSTSSFTNFSELKGKLNWPISKGKVVRKFGESLNPKLKTLTVNYGIDIRASGDMSVKCVAEGVVSAVEWLPGYGTVLIISHKGNYRTVYGHLSDVFVKEGDKVKTGGMIAKVGESLEGNILHFEVWSGRQNVDPEIWLRK
ncbi:MAG: peptidoglycan DD-metalloendopeptidase family protein [Ignavibacterium sp.]|jgi:septal ring factor EnvC (AmiA/AmiB activator)|nr:peptidoglycan DD-metalloendopeptidase family protein [Ignavibacterium sp.]